MENPDKPFPDVLGIMKSWIYGRSEPAAVSKDFWMPDHSCRVCYECDIQFNIFHRRHHCRLCGLVFCAKCTSNSVPVSPSGAKSFQEEVERMRVCNFCFKQWGQEKAAAENGMQVGLTRSPSEASVASTKSSSINGSFMTVGSNVYSTGPYERGRYRSSLTLGPSAQLDIFSDKMDMTAPRRSLESAPRRSEYIVKAEDTHFANRSDNEDGDDEDNEYGPPCRSDLDTQQFEASNDYYGDYELDDAESVYQFNQVRPADESDDPNEVCSPVHDDAGSHVSLGVNKVAEEAGADNCYEGGASSIYGAEGTVEDPVDFENNGLLWLPPEPEDEEDDREETLCDYDEEDATGDWGHLQPLNSFGSGESRSRDRSNEEHKKALKNVVDGHFRALVGQLLQIENLDVDGNNEKESWLEIITSLSWEAANFLKPDTSKGGGMDPGGYVKVKCIASGHRHQSMVVKGVVCKKNVAHRRMASQIGKPRLLILGGALEYQRVTTLLSSFDTLLQQEMDHLKMAVAKIDAHHPNVLLVEKSVSRVAQEYLLAKNISLVLNIRRPLLERIARCTGTQIVPSLDQLSSQKLGCCEFFRVEKFFEEHGSAGQGGKKMMKTLMFFEGCSKPLGCTILLRGANGDELKKVKHVIQYGIFAAYHLAMETSFLADEGASLPELFLNSPLTVGLPDMRSSIKRSISTVPGFTTSAEKLPLNDDMETPCKSDPTLTSGDFKEKKLTVSQGCNSTTIESALTMDTKKKANHVLYTENRSFSPHLSSSFTPSNPLPRHYPHSATKVKNKVGFLENHEDGMIRTAGESLAEGPVPVRHIDNLETVERHGLILTGSPVNSNEMIEKQLESSGPVTSNQNNYQSDERTLLKEEFPPSPSDHQSILVSLSTRCVWKGTVCERAHLFRIKYYGSFDKPLGRFLRDHLFDQYYRCRSCDMPSEAHVRCHIHRQGSLTISVRKLPEFLLPGEKDGKIWMWHRCLLCPRIDGFPPATRRVVMSDAAWGLSFGKFLELSFSNNAGASRVASCGHSLHKDCLRFYGFGKMVACFRYAPIDVHSVKLPSPKLDFSCQLLGWVQEEANEVAHSAGRLFSDVLSSLGQIAEKRLTSGSSNDTMKVPELHSLTSEFEDILQKERVEIEESLQRIMKKEAKKGQPVIDILEVNRLRRQLVFQSFLWDQRLIYASTVNFSPSEVLSGFSAGDKENASSISKLGAKPQGRFPIFDAISSDSMTSESFTGTVPFVNHQEGIMDRPNYSIVGQQSLDAKLESFEEKKNNTTLATSVSACDWLDKLETDFTIRRVLSDGQFPIMTDLSNTLDAKWRGESAPPLADASTSESSISAEATTTMSVSEDLEERNRAEWAQSILSSLPIKWGESAEEFFSWIGMPFYRSSNRNSESSTKFGSLSAYNPKYISPLRDIECQSGTRLLLPVGVNETVIPVYDEEPTSIISYALVSAEYHFQMSDERERVRDGWDSTSSLPTNDLGTSYSFQSTDEISAEKSRTIGSVDDDSLSLSGSRNPMVLDPLNNSKSMHVRVSFEDEGSLGKVKYTVTCYYAKYFDALRRTCCQYELDFIRSLSRCKKWGAQGGKSNVFFAKTLDDRFIVKQVTKTELDSFIKFAPEYFKYLSETISSRSPTCLAKILGIYQVTSKHLKGGKELKMDVLVMENLLFERNIARLYDLKGSSRSRYNPDSSGKNKVLLDQNLIEAMPTSPIFVGNKAKRLLERAVWNDTSFLASIDVMDYSLLVGVDEENNELVLGIIDFMRQYTWDKHLETWVKASGILGGPKNVSPTVISPKQYKKRFRKAMSAYFLMVPDQWSPPTTAPSKGQSEMSEDNQQVSVES